jgi:trans-2,3-dihydro-3-hydroxyanthranilate isomerase
VADVHTYDATAENGSGLAVTIVNACLREGRGGSPTAVLDETALSNNERRDVPVRMGTSHAVFVSVGGSGRASPEVSLRFFTAMGELPACGHGTVAALAYLAQRDGLHECQATIRASGRVFTGRAARVNGELRATFDPGFIDVCERAANEHDPDGLRGALWT